MPGYNSKCPNCNPCMVCHGTGQVERTHNVDPAKFKVVKVKEQCPHCGGRGGTPGPGPHNHS